MAVKQNTLWFGYLEAGKKSSLVVRDATLGTGTSTTIYLFNLNKGKILEYRRDIVEAKLRELTDDEKASLKELLEAFERARTGFVPRVARRPVSLPPPPKKRRREEAPDPDVENQDEPTLDDEDDDEDDDDSGPILDEDDENDED